VGSGVFWCVLVRFLLGSGGMRSGRFWCVLVGSWRGPGGVLLCSGVFWWVLVKRF
jgi:hypothetical protein